MGFGFFSNKAGIGERKKEKVGQRERKRGSLIQ
jgi:hypothetical protein